MGYGLEVMVIHNGFMRSKSCLDESPKTEKPPQNMSSNPNTTTVALKSLNNTENKQ